MEKTFNEKEFTLEVWYHIGLYENSIHFIFDHESKTCAIVDPAWEADKFIQNVENKGYKLTQIWLTHWHGDHSGAADEIQQKTGAEIFVGKNEVPYLDLSSTFTTIDDGDELALGNTKAKVINTPGHTAGGVCYLLDKHLIAGDTLFIYGAGHCHMPGGSVYDFFSSMQKLKTIDDDVILHCGHDYGDEVVSTMGEQKSGNAYLLIDNEDDFVNYINGMANGYIAYPTSAITASEIKAML